MKRFLLFSILIVIIFFSCDKSKSSSENTIGPVMQITASPVQRLDMVETILIYGEVKLRKEAFLASQFDGRLADFSLLIGDNVKKGDRIGIVIPPKREALLQVMNKIDLALRPMLEQQIKSIPLYSPIDGIVLKLYHHSGDVLSKGEAIIHIGDLTQLDVYGDLPLHYLPLVKKLKFITISFVDYPHSPLSLPIEAIGGQVDVAKQTVPIRLGLANRNGEFRPGMLVQLTFPGQVHKNALVIPRASLLEEEGIYSAFVVHSHKVEKRHVTVGIIKDDLVEVLSGLKEGERVATEKAYSLTDGMEVVIK